MAGKRRVKTKKVKETLEQKAQRLMRERLSQATQAVEREQSGVNPDMFLVPQAANVSLDFETWFEKDENHPQGGEWITRRRGRRTNNPFETLYIAKTLTKPEKVAGEYLVTLYAESHGLEGTPDDGYERVQCDTADPHEQAMRRAKAAERFMDITARIEKTRYKRLLKALVHDMVMGDGAGNLSDGGVRWRRVIATTLSLTSDKAQSKAMQTACKPLPDIIEAAERDWVRRERDLKNSRKKAA